MLVTGIEISGVQICRQTSRQSAAVHLTVGDQIVTLFSHVDVPEQDPGTPNLQAFINDALR